MTNRNYVPIQETEEEKQQRLNRKPLLEYNNKTEQSFKKFGFTSPDNLDHQEKHFLSLCEVNEEQEIERTVTKIVRLKAPDYSSKKKELVEYLVWYENWFGKNWLGVSIPPVTDHVEGVFEELIVDPVYDMRNRDIIGHKRTGQRKVHYVPFSKEKVDEIIKGSMGSDKDTIIFTVISGPLSYEFPYEKFVNSSFEELNQLLLRPGGPALVSANEAANATNGITIPPSSQTTNNNTKQQK